MPDSSVSQVEKMVTESAPASGVPHQQSLPVNLGQASANKENNSVVPEKQKAGAEASSKTDKQDDSVDDFQVVEMEQMNINDTQVVGPSLSQPVEAGINKDSSHVTASEPQQKLDKLLAAASSLNRDQQYSSHSGDSLVDMVTRLRNENQALIKALEVNNNFVKEQLGEFKQCQEESKRREAQFQLEKAELEHNLRKVQRQASVLSDRLKKMEAKLKDLNLEVSESLVAAQSSKNSSIRGENNLYPQLDDTRDESFRNSALRQEAAGTTMQVDATSGELQNEGDHQNNIATGSNRKQTNQRVANKVASRLSRKALKSAAKAARYASKQAHLEEKAAAALARAAAAKAEAAASHSTALSCKPTTGATGTTTASDHQLVSSAPHETLIGEPLAPHHHTRRHHHHHERHQPHHHRGAPRGGIRGEIVSDLKSTANKAMLTGYNLASTTINLALDKLNQFEQQQAAQTKNLYRPRVGVSSS